MMDRSEIDLCDGQTERLLELEVKVAQLQEALQSRVVIEQAKGVLAERLMVGVDEAFEILRFAARSHRMKLRELAARVVHDRSTPGPVVVALAKTARLRASWMRELGEAHHARVEELKVRIDDQAERLRLDPPQRRSTR